MNLLNLAITAAVLAGEEIMKVYETSDFEVESKADNSPLTLADRLAHKKIMVTLGSLGIPILSEEGKSIAFDERRSWETFWLVDPLDGTKEFIKRNGEFTVNIALINHGDPVLGVIYMPVTSELYYGEINSGSFKTIVEEAPLGEELIFGKVWHLPSMKPKKMTIVASRSHLNDETKEIIASKQKEFGEIELVSKGSSLKLCLVAEGSASYYPRLGPTMEWDTAAGHAIAVSAGCKVHRFDNKEPLKYNKENLLNPWFEVVRE